MESCWIVKFKDGRIKFYTEQEYTKTYKERSPREILLSEEHWYDVVRCKDTYRDLFQQDDLIRDCHDDSFERWISKTYNITTRKCINSDKTRPIDFTKDCDLAYLRMKYKRIIKQTMKEEGK